MIRKLIVTVLLIGAVYFSLQAGEFSTRDIMRQRERKAKLTAQIDSLQRQVDSLRRVEQAIRTDPVTQEKISREEFGMVRGEREVLYKFAAPAE